MFVDFIWRQSRGRRMSVCVKSDASVVVSVPGGVSAQQVFAFLREKEAWIIQKQQMARERLAICPVADVQALTQTAKDILTRKVAHYAVLLGVLPAKVTVGTARTRYGSCSVNGTVRFSCFLMLSDERAIDYVVVHELCHLKHMNHGAAFYHLVASVLPDWQERKKLLTPIPVR